MGRVEHFRISSHLKDIIGRDLVTDEFVAVFELVKNAFDADATRVEIAFDIHNDRLWIVDDGKGMSGDTIRDRWLFVAYSAKAEGTEDEDYDPDYRNKIRPQGQFAGSKGIGRFSCDTLGGELTLYSRDKSSQKVQTVGIEWEAFEENARELFQSIEVEMDERDDFPDIPRLTSLRESGTILEIRNLRSNWEYDDIAKLRSDLAKLIDPFGTTEDTPVNIVIVSSDFDDDEIDDLQGPVSNNIQDVLSEKTTRVEVTIESGKITSELVDRDMTIYRIKESSEYEALLGANIHASIFYLNRSAKATFTRRMGVRSVEFGSVFLFVNGFRIFPIGNETDDIWLE